jgi:hypothetical protein
MIYLQKGIQMIAVCNNAAGNAIKDKLLAKGFIIIGR